MNLPTRSLPARRARTRERFPGRPCARALLLIGLLHLACSVAAQDRARVLILNSYHRGFAWSDAEEAGVLSRLGEAHADMDVPVEYLDAKRFPDADSQMRAVAYLRRKYAGREPELVVALDNPALDLLVRHGDLLFGGIPVVFAGVSGVGHPQEASRRRITGVAEIQDVKSTLELALRLHPRTREILVVDDTTSSGVSSRQAVEAIAPSLAGRVRIRFLPPVTFDEAGDLIRGLPADTVVYIDSFSTDGTGHSLSLAASTKVLTAGVRVPVYAGHETRLGHGIVGGYLLDGRDHGRRAGEIALRVLGGEDPGEIPVDTTGAVRPKFDYVQLRRFGLSPASLPADSVVINRAASIFDQYRGLVIGTLLVFTLLVVMLTSLTVAIVQRRRAESALRKSEERLRLALEGTNDGIWDWNILTGDAYFSARYYTMLGYEPGEFPPTYASWRGLVHPDDIGRAEDLLKIARDSHTVFACEFRLLTRDGRWQWTLGRGKVVEVDAEGRPTRMAGSHVDVTDRRKAEEEIRQLNEDLERRVASRTAQLAAAIQEMEAFSYSVSHDLRAPLRAIDGYSRMLTDDRATLNEPEVQRICSVIRDETHRMARLIDDLLALSRLSRAQLQTSRVDMASLAAEVAGELAPPQTRQRLVIRLAELPPTNGDPGLLRQVWANLLDNAIKFSSHRDRPVVEVGGRADESELVYYVRDNGAGFDMRYADKLFRVFERLHSAKEFGGTGVGLAIVRRIVDRHDGRVWAEGGVDQGATVWFALPRRGPRDQEPR